MSTDRNLQQEILTRVKELKSTATPELIQQLKQSNSDLRDTDVRSAVGTLIDRGQIVVSRDWKLELSPQ